MTRRQDVCFLRFVFYARVALFLSCCLWFALGRVSLVRAEEEIPGQNPFRIDSVLTIHQDEEIIEIKNSTIFFEGKVLDFIGDNGEIIIYDTQERLFTLLDPIHRVRTELQQVEIDRFFSSIEKQIQEQKDRFCLFMLHPEFEISRNDEQGEILFQSHWIDYRIDTRQLDADIADDYYRFSNVYSQLNVFLNPGTVTPLARIKINETLYAERRFPAKMSVLVYPKGKWIFARMVEYESEHKIIRRLSEDDRGRILRAMLFAKQFQKMTFGKYYQTVNGSDQLQK